MVKINEKISYIETSNDPLSADIGVVKVGEQTWLFDVGNGEKNISELVGEYNVVLSHFHQDHTGNIEKVNIGELFLSKETYNHIGRGTIVNDDIHIGNLHIFPIPSSHTKGCIGLEIDNEYVFVGDALYSKVKDGYYVYNSQLLKEEIEVFEKIRADKFLVSHFEGLIRNKEDVINDLKKIYAQRDKNSSDIRIAAED